MTDGVFAYGRQLQGADVEFYDLFLRADEVADLTTLPERRVLFQLYVMDYAFKRNGRWDLLDVVTLTDEEASRVTRTWKCDPINGRLSIYWSDRAAKTWGEEPAAPAECIGLEQCAVWDPEHVEERLRAYLGGQTVWPAERCGPFTLDYWERRA